MWGSIAAMMIVFSCALHDPGHGDGDGDAAVMNYKAQMAQGGGNMSSIRNSSTISITTCPSAAIYSFGDSLADTGNVEYVFPFQAPAENQPYGEQAPFRKPSFRYSDGRLVIDFLAQAFSLPFINPYMQLITPDYTHGCNFAISGSTAANVTSPFSLQTQVNQFLRFRTIVLQTLQLSAPPSPAAASYNDSTEATAGHVATSVSQMKIPASESFADSLYIISIGGNDFMYAYDYYAPSAFIQQVVTPRVVDAITSAVETLYREDARWIMVWNIPAQGCAPIILSRFGPTATSDDFDSLGCLKSYNDPIQRYNRLLRAAVQSLQQNYTSARIIYADYYAANIDILSNATQFGFDPNSTLKACCGVGGQYSYNTDSTCGDPRVPACDNPSQFVNWDGVHFTEAFYRTIAKFFLNGRYLHPSINISSACSLNFTNF